MLQDQAKATPQLAVYSCESYRESGLEKFSRMSAQDSDCKLQAQECLNVETSLQTCIAKSTILYISSIH